MRTRRFVVRGRGIAASQVVTLVGSEFAALNSLRFNYLEFNCDAKFSF